MQQFPEVVRPYDASGLSAAVGRLPIRSIRRAPSIGLDGTWDFQLLTAESAPVSASWEAVDVPELWTMRSSGDPPHYTNVPMPFDEAPPTVPARNPVGVYRRDVTLQCREGYRQILHVGSAEGYLRVAVNGVAVGTSTDSHLEAEFDVTDFLNAGLNTVELRIAKWSAQTYLEDQDQWWHSGISRSVFIYEIPEVHIGDVVAVADFDPESGTGSLHIDVRTEGLAHRWDTSGWTVQVTVLGETRITPVPTRQAAQSIPKPEDVRASRPSPRLPPDFMDLLSIRAAGAPVPERFAAVAGRFAQTLNHGAEAGVGRDERTGLDVLPWTAETPHLETVTVGLLDQAGIVVDEVVLTIGFRRVQIVGRDLLVNGRRIMIQGVNRHDVDPQTGRVMTRERMRAELSLLKRFNVNAIRAAHYPNDPYLLDLCDELGLYVFDEADIEGHAFAGTLADDPRYLPAFLERYSRMVIRDRNHPSVIVWSLGNETGYGAAHDALAAWSRRFDPTRPVHYEGAISTDWHGGHAATDIVCPMYPSFESLEAFSGDSRVDRPLILCEYAYSQGNGTGGFAHYWDIFESVPGLQGGFIWELLDHALDPEGNGRTLYGGDFGDTPNDGYICLNGLAFSDLTPKPAFYEVRAVFSPVRIASDANQARGGSLRLRNRQTFADLSSFQFEVHVETASGQTPVEKLPPLHTGPGEEVLLTLPPSILSALEREDALALSLTVRTAETSAWAPAGTELVTQQIRLERTIQPLPKGNQVPVLDDSGNIRHPLLVSGPCLSLWRAVTDNDESFALDNRFVRSGFFALESVNQTVTHKGQTAVAVVTTYRTAFGDEVVHRREISSLGDDDWTFDETVELPDGTADGLRVGMEFALTEGLDSAEWTGLGPWENFPDRASGALLGRWSSAIDDLAVPYVYPQHNGTRGGVTDLELTGPGGTITLSGEREMHATVVRHTPAELEAASHWWKLPDSKHTVVHLDVAHRGVGMARLGPDTQAAHRLSGSRYSWRWRLSVTQR